MGRLLDSDTVEKVLRDYADDVGCNRGEYELANGILKAVSKLRDVPTAYDPEKVADCLEKSSTLYSLSERDCEFAIRQDLAVHIVRKGGAE